MNRLQEIEARLREIHSDIEKRGDQLTADEVNAYETEVNSLKEERKALQDAAEKRQQILDGIAGGMGLQQKHSLPRPTRQAANSAAQSLTSLTRWNTAKRL